MTSFSEQPARYSNQQPVAALPRVPLHLLLQLLSVLLVVTCRPQHLPRVNRQEAVSSPPPLRKPRLSGMMPSLAKASDAARTTPLFPMVTPLLTLARPVMISSQNMIATLHFRHSIATPGQSRSPEVYLRQARPILKQSTRLRRR